MTQPIPVTVLSIFPDSKTQRVLDRVKQGSTGVAVTALVRKRPGKRSRRKLAPWMVPTTPRLVKLGKGCSCCTVRADISAKLGRMFTAAVTDHVLLVSPAREDLEVLAKTFTVADDNSQRLADQATLRSVTVVAEAHALTEAELAGNRDLVQRVEIADVVVLSGEGSVLSTAERIVRALNPHAQVHIWGSGPLTVDMLTSCTPFNLHNAHRRALGANILDGEDATDGEEGVVRFAFRARRPFHPERLHMLLNAPWPGILRARGTFWVASRPDHVGVLDAIGHDRATSARWAWWAAVAKEDWPQNPTIVHELERDWHPAFGDRRQELAISGVNVGREQFQSHLEACLLTDAELELPQRWRSLPHPFAWLKHVS